MSPEICRPWSENNNNNNLCNPKFWSWQKNYWKNSLVSDHTVSKSIKICWDCSLEELNWAYIGKPFPLIVYFCVGKNTVVFLYLKMLDFFVCVWSYSKPEHTPAGRILHHNHAHYSKSLLKKEGRNTNISAYSSMPISNICFPPSMEHQHGAEQV